MTPHMTVEIFEKQAGQLHHEVAPLCTYSYAFPQLRFITGN